jgi:hypothetical protein
MLYQIKTCIRVRLDQALLSAQSRDKNWHSALTVTKRENAMMVIRDDISAA